MRLSWKLFFVITPLFVVFLTVFGSWMIQDSFQSNLEKEIQRYMVENQMMQNSYELTWEGLTLSQKKQITTEQVVESFYRGQMENNGNFRLYNEEGEVIYEDRKFRLEHGMLEELNDVSNAGYELVKENDRVYLVVVGKSSLGIYVETIRDISDIYEERSQMYSRYRLGGMILIFLVGGILLMMLLLVTRNIQKLSRATREFARGMYHTRVGMTSNDEIGALADDFNWMADVMNNQMTRLQDEVRRQEEFTAAFAHELKTPLTAIIGYADTIRQMELSKEENDMCADYIYHQGKRLQSLAYKLLEMTTVDRQEITFRKIRITELTEEIASTAKNSLQEKQMTLVTDVEDGWVFGDRDLLSSVFLNLIDNARKAAPAGSVIRLRGNFLREGYVFQVEDQGPGVPPEELSRITEAFYMVDKSRSRKEGGAGLGLALCGKIISLHQGSWKIESEPGMGLKVTVLLGAARSEREICRRRKQKE